MKADISKEFGNIDLTEVITICELQEHVFSLTQSSLPSTVKYISNSLFADSKERISQLVSNIFNAIKIRPSSTSLYAHFTKELISLSSPENELGYISSIILDPFPSITYPSFDRLAFLNECLKLEVITEKQIFDSIRINYIKYPHTFLPWKYSFVWFMPLILRNDSKLFQDMYLQLRESVGSTRNANPIKNESNASTSPKEENIVQSSVLIDKQNDQSVQPNLHSYSLEVVNSPLNKDNHDQPPKTDLPPAIDGQHGNIPVIPISNSQPHLTSNQPPNFTKNTNESTSQESDIQSSSSLNLNTKSNRVHKNIKLCKTKFYSILNSTSETYPKAGNDQQTNNIYNNPNRELADFLESVQYLKNDNWSFYNKMISDTYVPNSLPAILKEDRVHDLVKMIDKYNENEKKRIKKIEIENETSDEYVYDYEEEEEEEEDNDNGNGKQKRKILVKLTDNDNYEYESSSTYNDSPTSSSRNLDSTNEDGNDPETYSIRFQKSSGKFHTLKNSFIEKKENNSNDVAKMKSDQNSTNSPQNNGNKSDINLTLNDMNNENKQENQVVKSTENQVDPTQNDKIQADPTKSDDNQTEQTKNDLNKAESSEISENQNDEISISQRKTQSSITLSDEIKRKTEATKSNETAQSDSRRRRIKRPRVHRDVPEFVGFNLNQRIVSTVFEKNNFLRNGPTLIQFAAFYGSVLCVNELIRRGADILLSDLSNKKTSMFAVAGGNMKIIEMLEYQLDDFTSTPQVAAFFIRPEAFKRLMSTERFSLDQVDDHYSSVLHQAAASNNIRVMIYCIERNVDVNITNIKNFTPLHLAVSNGQLDATLLLTAHKKINVNAKSIDGLTPLMVAAKNGYVKIVSALLSNPNINVNEVDNKLSTALHFAAALNNFVVVKLLVDHKGIDLSIKDNNGKTAVELASAGGFNECAQYIGDHMKSDCSIA